MAKVCVLISLTLCGWVGWWLGSYFGLLAAYLLSFVGGIVGLWVGYRFIRDYLE